MTSGIRTGIFALAALVALIGCGDDAPVDEGVAAEQPDRVEPESTSSTSTSTTGPGTGSAAEPAAYLDEATAGVVGASDLDEGIARCIVTAFLDAAGGAQALADAGLTPETWMYSSETFAELGLPSDDATVAALADDLGGCADGFDLLLGRVAKGPGDDVRDCIGAAVDEAEVRRQLALSGIRGGDALGTDDVDVFELVDACEDEPRAG